LALISFPFHHYNIAKPVPTTPTSTPHTSNATIPTASFLCVATGTAVPVVVALGMPPGTVPVPGIAIQILTNNPEISIAAPTSAPLHTPQTPLSPGKIYIPCTAPSLGPTFWLQLAHAPS